MGRGGEEKNEALRIEQATARERARVVSSCSTGGSRRVSWDGGLCRKRRRLLGASEECDALGRVPKGARGRGGARRRDVPWTCREKRTVRAFGGASTRGSARGAWRASAGVPDASSGGADVACTPGRLSVGRSRTGARRVARGATNAANASRGARATRASSSLARSALAGGWAGGESEVEGVSGHARARDSPPEGSCSGGGNAAPSCALRVVSPTPASTPRVPACDKRLALVLAMPPLEGRARAESPPPRADAFSARAPTPTKHVRYRVFKHHRTAARESVGRKRRPISHHRSSARSSTSTNTAASPPSSSAAVTPPSTTTSSSVTVTIARRLSPPAPMTSPTYLPFAGG